MRAPWQDRSVESLHLILGDDEFLIDRTIRRIITDVKSSMSGTADDLPVTSLRAGEVTASEIMELLSPSLFAEDRVVVLRAAGEAGKEAVEIITRTAQEPVPGVVLIVVHDGKGRAKSLVPTLTTAGATVTECPKITKPTELSAFVAAEFRQAGIRPTADTVHALLDALGSDLRELASAVSQLVADTGGRVSPETVRQYYAGVAGVTGFNVADAALSGDVANALTTLRWALAGGLSPVPIADAVGDAVLSLARVSSVGPVDPFRSASELGMPPWKVKKAQQQLGRWDRARLAEAMEVATTLNGAVKGQQVDPLFALEKAVRDIAQLAAGQRS